MRKTFNIIKKDTFFQSQWTDIPYIAIDSYPWKSDNYCPVTEARLFYTDSHLHVHFKAFEDNIRAVYTNLNDPVSKDSCVEFFFNFDTSTANYMNIEVNAIGTLLIAYGSKDCRKYLELEEYKKFFNVKTSVTENTLEDYSGPFWTVEYDIPFSFLRQFFGDFKIASGFKFYGNFYKCGDQTQYPHYGCWNEIINDYPRFHIPEYFGELTFL